MLLERPPRRARRRASRSRPGETSFSLRAHAALRRRNRCRCCSDAYERFGPIFTLRLFHGNVVFMLGPGGEPLHARSRTPSNFIWREGHFRDLIGADGRRPADDRRRVPPALAADHAPGVPPRAHRGLRRRRSSRRPSARSQGSSRARARPVRVDAPARAARRDAGAVRPRPGRRTRRARSTPPALFEEALAFYASDYLLRVLRGPRTPWARMQRGGAQARHADLRGDRRAARDAASAAATSSACCSTPRTRTATA